MERMGHSSTPAALVYLHATRERDEAVAAGMGKVLREASEKRNAASGTGTQRGYAAATCGARLLDLAWPGLRAGIIAE
jgi:hypothetical protein